MRKCLLLILVFGLLAAPVSAQRLNIDIPGLDARAAEVVDVTLDASMLRMAARFFSSQDADTRGIREVVQGLQGIYVRSYEFDREGEYDRTIVDRVRKQLGPSWKKVVNVRGRKETVEVYLDMRGDDVVGLTVISAEPRELTLVNIVGPIDLEKLSKIEGQFGIPRMSMKKEKDQ